MRRFSPIAVLMTAVLALSACGTSTANTGGPVKLTYFTFSAAPDHLTDLNTIISAFHSQHSNITIDVQTASYNDYFTKLQTAIAGGTAPDTFELNYENFVSYSSAGSLLDLSGQASSDSGFKSSVYYPRAYGVFNDADGRAQRAVIVIDPADAVLFLARWRSWPSTVVARGATRVARAARDTTKRLLIEWSSPNPGLFSCSSCGDGRTSALRRTPRTCTRGAERSSPDGDRAGSSSSRAA